MQQTSDTGYVIAGWTYSYGDYTPSYPNVYVIKTNAQGDTTWTKAYEFGGAHEDKAYSIQQTNDNGYILTGYSSRWESSDWRTDLRLIKLDSSGNLMWARQYEELIPGDWEEGYSVQQTSGLGYILCGRITSIGWSYGVLIKTDSLGNLSWWRQLDYAGAQIAHCVREVSNGGYILVESDWYNVWLEKRDLAGSREWVKQYGGSDYDYCNSVEQTSDSGYIIVGTTQSYGAGSYDVYLIKTDSLGIVAGIEENKNTKAKTQREILEIYPNPVHVNPKTSIIYYLAAPNYTTLRVYNLAGQLVKTLMNGQLSAGCHTAVWDGCDTEGESVTSGIYFIRLQASNFSAVRKITVLR